MKCFHSVHIVFIFNMNFGMIMKRTKKESSRGSEINNIIYISFWQATSKLGFWTFSDVFTKQRNHYRKVAGCGRFWPHHNIILPLMHLQNHFQLNHPNPAGKYPSGHTGESLTTAILLPDLLICASSGWSECNQDGCSNLPHHKTYAPNISVAILTVPAFFYVMHFFLHPFQPDQGIHG